MSKVYSLKVIEIKEETKNAVSITFNIPNELHNVFKYKPGQYITVQFDLNGKQVRRSYSLCNSPIIENILQIGVKRVKKGLVSNYINDRIKIGDFIEVLPPGGCFYAEIKKENYKTYYLFTAGSGVTPIMSILKTVLQVEERSFVYMIYGNRSQETIMFQEDLKSLEKKYKNRFVLVHTLSRSKNSWSDLWKTSNNEFRKGRIDISSIEWFIKAYPPYAQNVEYYVCGPGRMIDNTLKGLRNIDVPNNRIFVEKFGIESTINKVEVVENARLIVDLKGKRIEVTIPKGKTILRTLLDRGYSPPYLCEGGVCSTCICKVKRGKLSMNNNLSLTNKEIEDGYVLSCQSLPITKEVHVIYE